MSLELPDQKTAIPHRFDVSKLVGLSLDEDGKNIPRGLLHRLASKSVREQWKVDGSAQDKQEVICSALIKVAKSALGVEKQRHTYWFSESDNSLEPIPQK